MSHIYKINGFIVGLFIVKIIDSIEVLKTVFENITLNLTTRTDEYYVGVVVRELKVIRCLLPRLFFQPYGEILLLKKALLVRLSSTACALSWVTEWKLNNIPVTQACRIDAVIGLLQLPVRAEQEMADNVRKT